MGILGGRTKDGGDVSTANPWAGRVKARAVAAPWWPTESVQAVVEVHVAGPAGGLFTVLVHVTRSAKSGRLFVSMPSTKRDGEWIPQVTLDDAQLAKAIEVVAIQACERWQLETQGAAAADDGLPF